MKTKKIVLGVFAVVALLVVGAGIGSLAGGNMQGNLFKANQKEVSLKMKPVNGVTNKLPVAATMPQSTAPSTSIPEINGSCYLNFTHNYPGGTSNYCMNQGASFNLPVNHSLVVKTGNSSRVTYGIPGVCRDSIGNNNRTEVKFNCSDTAEFKVGKEFPGTPANLDDFVTITVFNTTVSRAYCDTLQRMVNEIASFSGRGLTPVLNANPALSEEVYAKTLECNRVYPYSIAFPGLR